MSGFVLKSPGKYILRARLKASFDLEKTSTERSSLMVAAYLEYAPSQIICENMFQMFRNRNMANKK